MTTRKRNEFLDPLLSDDEEASDRGYDSEAAEESKGRSIKRQRKDTIRGTDDEDEESENEQSDEEEQSRPKSISQPKQTKTSDDEDEDENDEDRDTDTDPNPNPKPKQKPLDKTKLAKKSAIANAKKNKTGVIYFSSLPPYLKPAALKTLLTQRGFSPITRVFLTPATPSQSSQRRSNKRKTYADGWVEFASKRTAKICAETLNATIVGGKKGGWYHDDVWNMKYLKGFKWNDLMEQVQRERSEREAKRRIEDARAKKEEKVFVEGVEKGRIVEGIRKKNEERGKGTGDGEVRRLFKQNDVKSGKTGSSEVLDDDAKRVLGKIF